jgi:hypothetical protein
LHIENFLQLTLGFFVSTGVSSLSLLLGSLFGGVCLALGAPFVAPFGLFDWHIGKCPETLSVFILSERLAPPRAAGALFITFGSAAPYARAEPSFLAECQRVP